MTTRTTRRPLATLVAALLTASTFSVLAPLQAGADEQGCTNRTLILAAMPLELNPLIAVATLESQQTVTPEGEQPRTFYTGSIRGEDVVLAMTGVGMVNAAQTTAAAFDELGTCFRGVVFSGVAGSPHNIGDVDIAAEWTIDGEPDAMPVDAAMLDTAQQLAGTSAVALSQTVPVGDAACLCPGVDAATPVTMPQPMAVHVGGSGTTSDLFGGHAVPCMPGGGDIAGCKPCITTPGFDQDAAAFAESFPKILNPTFFQGFFRSGGSGGSYVSYDMETALVAEAAAAHGVPFLGVRAVSDGASDPLRLPGFPAQFAAYRQLAGNNAAAVTIAFLEVWAAEGYPTAG